MKEFKGKYIIDPAQIESKISVQDFIDGIVKNTNLGEFALKAGSPTFDNGPGLFIKLYVTHTRSHACYYIYYDKDGIKYIRCFEDGTGMTYRGAKPRVMKNTFDLSKVTHIRSISADVRFDSVYTVLPIGSGIPSIDMKLIKLDISLRGIRLKKDLTLANLQYNVVEGLISSVK